jgi:hypothetical protein
MQCIGLLLAAAIGCTLQASVAGAQPMLQVRSVITLPAATVQGLGVRELSALAWVPEQRVLYAASDRGRLFAYRLQWRDGTLTAAEPVAAWPLQSAPGKALNVEALTWRRATPDAPAALLVAPERGAHAWSWPTSPPQRGALQPLPWPPAIASALAPASAPHGVEAMTWHAQHGTVAVLQRPASAPLPRHVLHADDGTRWTVVPAAPRADVKAIELLGGNRLLLLERVRGASASTPAFVLRQVRLDDCNAAACDPPAMPLRGEGLDGQEQFEGLACLSDTNCLLVSDDGAARSGSTRLVQIALGG